MGVSAKPKISIITPSFNQVQFLEATMRSVLDQNYENLEYIVIDGGSNDGSKEIIKKYSDQLAYWVSEKDEGQTHAINKGFQKATGDLVAWMNSDDTYLPGAFEKVAEYYNRYPNVDVLYADKHHIDEDGNFLHSQRYVPYRLYTFANDKMVMCNQSAFWKRDIFEKIGYLDETIQFAMDYEFFVRLGVHKLNMKHFPEFWGEQRYYSGTKTSDEKWLKILAENHKSINAKFGLKKSKWLKYRSLFHRLSYYISKGNFSYIFEKKTT